MNMKSLIKKQILLIVCIFFVNGFIQAENSQVVVYVSKTIRLADAVEKAGMQIYNIRNLKVIGEMDSVDMSLLRMMSKDKLNTLDLYDADYTGSLDFQNCGSLMSIKLMSNLSEIPSWSFNNCHINYIFIPKSLKKIGKYAFNGCSMINDVEIEDLDAWYHVEFEDYHFGYDECKLWLNGEEIKNIVVPNGISKMNDYVFAGTSNLVSVNLPNSLKEIGIRSFIGCYNLSYINIPESVTKIGIGAFCGCESIDSLYIPNNVCEIEREAFWGIGVTSITIPGRVKDIGDDTFRSSHQLKNVYLSDGIERIGNCCFWGCNNLSTVVIPNSITDIDNSAFNYCNKLQSLSIPSSVKHIGSNVFCHCDDLTSIYVYGNIPPEIDKHYLKSSDDCNLQEHCTLYVPKGCVEAYRSSNWYTYFNNIKEFDAETGVHATGASSQPTETSRYDINGQKIEKLAKGINIIKYSDGSVRKEFAK